MGSAARRSAAGFLVRAVVARGNLDRGEHVVQLDAQQAGNTDDWRCGGIDTGGATRLRPYARSLDRSVVSG
ncbi:MAG TPA: hypothetical protein VNF73_13045 [Candidatus Saccharimonadales bacterium]|nr:hypothetical protein [Candidatus Saccharimonadales bacterium]